MAQRKGKLVQLGGLEPPTSGSTDRRSNQLSYSCTGAGTRHARSAILRNLEHFPEKWNRLFRPKSPAGPVSAEALLRPAGPWSHGRTILFKAKARAIGPGFQIDVRN